jgi:multiple sugar transport system substrate-binding protein
MSSLARSLPRRRFVVSLVTAGAAVALSACGGAGIAPAVTAVASLAPPQAAASTAPASTSAATTVTATSVPSASSAAATAATAATSGSATSTAAAAVAATTSGLTTAGLTLNAPAGAKATIRFSSWGTLTSQNVPIYNAFMQQNPSIAINFDTVGTFSEYFSKVQLQTASGTGPDVLAHSPYYVVVFAAKKVTRALDDLVARDKIDLTQLYAPLVASSRWQAGNVAVGAGSLHQIPANLNTGTLYFYNKTLFQQAGVQPPDESWTWDTMLENAMKMTRATGANGNPQYGLGLPEDGNGSIYTWIWQNGGDFFDKDFTQCTLRSDGKAYDAFSFLVDLVHKQKVAAGPSTGDRIKLFTSGAAAMTPGGMWWSQTIAPTPSLDWDVFLPPKNPTTGLRVIDIYTNGVAIGTTSKYVDETWTFLKWDTMGDGLPLEIANLPGYVPAHIATAEKYVFNPQRTTPPKSISLYSDVLKNGHVTFVVAGQGDIATATGKPQTDAFSGTLTVDAAATTIQQQVTSILNQQRAQLGL